MCRELYVKFNWGNYAARLSLTAQAGNVREMTLTNFATTRFANSKRNVFRSIYLMVKPMAQVFVEDILKDYNNENLSKQRLEARQSELKEKADMSYNLRGRLCTSKTLLRLAGVCDIYQIFGKIVNATQAVHQMPHIRYDQFMKGVSEMKSMSNITSANYDFFTKAKTSLLQESKICDILVQDTSPEIAACTQRVTRSSDSVVRDWNPVRDVEQVGKELETLAEALSTKIKEETIDESEKKVIEASRSVLDVHRTLDEMKKFNMSPVLYGSMNFENFKKAIKELNVKEVLTVTDDILLRQYKIFLSRLLKLDSKKDLEFNLKRLFSSKENEKLYEDCELIMQVLSVAMLCNTVESYIESFVSVFECHFDSRRNLNEESMTNEFNIAINGPTLSKADGVLTKALNMYFDSTNWRFVSSDRDNLNKYKTSSQVIEKIRKENNKFNFM